MCDVSSPPSRISPDSAGRSSPTTHARRCRHSLPLPKLIPNPTGSRFRTIASSLMRWSGTSSGRRRVKSRRRRWLASRRAASGGLLQFLLCLSCAVRNPRSPIRVSVSTRPFAIGCVVRSVVRQAGNVTSRETHTSFDSGLNIVALYDTPSRLVWSRLASSYKLAHPAVASSSRPCILSGCRPHSTIGKDEQTRQRNL